MLGFRRFVAKQEGFDVGERVEEASKRQGN